MKKSVYSLVLMDDVVDAIDRLAYRQHVSRSGLINQILAEHVALSTPEQRMRDVFSCLEDLMDETFRIQPQSGSTMLSMLSALRFKYKPTIRYSVELYPESQGGVIGQLKISFRSQNPALLTAIGQFFSILEEIENRYLAGRFPDGIHFTASDGRVTRDIHLPTEPENRDPEALGSAIASYIQLLDRLIKQYFSDLGDPELAALGVDKAYRQAQTINEGEVLV